MSNTQLHQFYKGHLNATDELSELKTELVTPSDKVLAACERATLAAPPSAMP